MLQEVDRSMLDGLGNQRVSTCYLAKLYRYGEERNAWQWTTSRTYGGSGAYCVSLSQAKSEVEAERKQGSSWQIDEVPSVVISDGEQSAIVAAHSPTKPFAGLEEVVLPSASFRAILIAVLDVESDYLLVSKEGVAPAKFPFRSFCSFVEGPGRKLGWFAKVEEKTRDFGCLHNFVRRLHETMQKQ